jgi:hypothetical protein
VSTVICEAEIGPSLPLASLSPNLGATTTGEHKTRCTMESTDASEAGCPAPHNEDSVEPQP